MVVLVCNLYTWEAEAKGSQIWVWSGKFNNLQTFVLKIAKKIVIDQEEDFGFIPYCPSPQKH